MRWQWLKRPRWGVTAAIFLSFGIWILWPIQVYRIDSPTGRFDSGVMIHLDDTGFDFDPINVSVYCFYSELEADRLFEELKPISASRQSIDGIGDEAMWLLEIAPGNHLHQFSFRQTNLIFTMAARFDRNGENASSKRDEVEAFARELGQDVDAGQLLQIKSTRRPIGWLWVMSRLRRLF